MKKTRNIEDILEDILVEIRALRRYYFFDNEKEVMEPKDEKSGV